MGRPRKPDYLKILDGDRKDRIGKSFVQGVGKIGDPPASLDPVATAHWAEIRDAATWLTASDSMILELLCSTYSDWRKCHEIIDRDGMILETVIVRRSMVRGETSRTVKRRRHPLLPHALRLGKFMIHVGDQMGLNPRNRARLGVGRSERPEDDALIRFMRARVAPESSPTAPPNP